QVVNSYNAMDRSTIPEHVGDKNSQPEIREARFDANVSQDPTIYSSGDVQSEIESLPSLTAGSSCSSADSIAELQSAVQEFADLLLKDESLTPLYVQALERVDTAKFERNFARLLKNFAADLRAEAVSVVEISAVQFVGARAKNIAGCMGMELDPTRRAESERMHEFVMDAHERGEKVEMYLRRQVMYSNPSEINFSTESKDADYPCHESDSDSDKDDLEPQAPPSLRNLVGVKDFIVASAALANLRRSFRQFASQGQRKVQVPREITASSLIPHGETTGHDSLTSESESESVVSLRNGQSMPFTMTGFFKQAAEFLEPSETPLRPGYTRIRWTCVCGANLYDDFKEVATGALNELQDFLDYHRGIHQATYSSQPTTNRTGGNGDEATPSSHPAQTPSANNSRIGTNEREDNVPPGLRRRRRSRRRLSSSEATSSDTWVLPIFDRGHDRTAVDHLPVHATMSDEILFKTLKGRYFKQSSRLRRFLTLRSVKKISYVKFIHAPREPDIQKFDDWPLKKHAPPWEYKGCPAKKRQLPLVGSTYLMHMWQNPSHSDPESYKPGLLDIVRRKLRRAIYIGRVVCTSPPEDTHSTSSSIEAHRDIELGSTNGPDSQCSRNATNSQESRGSRSCYVLLRTPKKIGERLEADDDDPPEAWGLYFEEGFGIHHFWLIVLFLYIMATMGFAIYWCERYGFVGPHSGVAAFEVASWMIALVSLLLTVWLKWAD
ncbi:MAG: hypothetical protein L6R39_007436, partial [Caloplaca ligustica]